MIYADGNDLIYCGVGYGPILEGITILEFKRTAILRTIMVIFLQTIIMKVLKNTFKTNKATEPSAEPPMDTISRRLTPKCSGCSSDCQPETSNINIYDS